MTCHPKIPDQKDLYICLKCPQNHLLCLKTLQKFGNFSELELCKSYVELDIMRTACLNLFAAPIQFVTFNKSFHPSVCPFPQIMNLVSWSLLAEGRSHEWFNVRPALKRATNSVSRKVPLFWSEREYAKFQDSASLHTSSDWTLNLSYFFLPYFQPKSQEKQRFEF